MPTSNDPTRRMRLVLPLAGAIILSLFAALYPSDPSTARGALCGGGLVLVAFLVARHVRGGRDNAFVRGAKGQADERDALILARAGACVGLGIVSSDARATHQIGGGSCHLFVERMDDDDVQQPASLFHCPATFALAQPMESTRKTGPGILVVHDARRSTTAHTGKGLHRWVPTCTVDRAARPGGAATGRGAAERPAPSRARRATGRAPRPCRPPAPASSSRPPAGPRR